MALNQRKDTLSTRSQRWSNSTTSTYRYSPIIERLDPPSGLRDGLTFEQIRAGFVFGNSKFVLVRRIGNGSYGEIWLGSNKGNYNCSGKSYHTSRCALPGHDH